MKRFYLSLIFLIPLTGLTYGQSNLNIESSVDTNQLYTLEELEYRFGKRAAYLISNEQIDIGFTKTMVQLAIGEPYLIEEPLGHKMDHEIHYYKNYVVFIDYGVVIYIRHIPPPGGIQDQS